MKLLLPAVPTSSKFCQVLISLLLTSSFKAPPEIGSCCHLKFHPFIHYLHFDVWLLEVTQHTRKPDKFPALVGNYCNSRCAVLFCGSVMTVILSTMVWRRNGRCRRRNGSVGVSWFSVLVLKGNAFISNLLWLSEFLYFIYMVKYCSLI